MWEESLWRLRAWMKILGVLLIGAVILLTVCRKADVAEREPAAKWKHTDGKLSGH